MSDTQLRPQAAAEGRKGCGSRRCLARCCRAGPAASCDCARWDAAVHTLTTVTRSRERTVLTAPAKLDSTLRPAESQGAWARSRAPGFPSSPLLGSWWGGRPRDRTGPGAAGRAIEDCCRSPGVLLVLSSARRPVAVARPYNPELPSFLFPPSPINHLARSHPQLCALSGLSSLQDVRARLRLLTRHLRLCDCARCHCFPPISTVLTFISRPFSISPASISFSSTHQPECSFLPRSSSRLSLLAPWARRLPVRPHSGLLL